VEEDLGMTSPAKTDCAHIDNRGMNAAQNRWLPSIAMREGCASSKHAAHSLMRLVSTPCFASPIADDRALCPPTADSRVGPQRAPWTSFWRTRIVGKGGTAGGTPTGEQLPAQFRLQ